MKIDEPMTKLNYQVANNQTLGSDFEHYMDNSTNLSSGDEYYRQHQDQLERSDLKFQSPLNAKHVNLLEIRTPKISFESRSLLESTSEVTNVPIHIVNPESRVANAENPLAVSLNQVITNPQANQQSVKACPLYSTNNDIPKIESSNLATECTFTNYIAGNLKNHHVFLDGSQAELSLNTQDLNSEEESELTQIIRNSLKEKGITLRELIINGVIK